ncbi:hypothetical protein [Hydrogenimonas sp.]
MREMIERFFADYAFFILFFHVLGAIIWVGGMIAIRVAVHPGLQHIEDSKTRLARTLEITQRLFNLVLPFIVILLLTGVVMAMGMGFKGTPMNGFVHIKEAVWTVMTINYAWMVLKRNRAQRLFLSGDLSGAKEALSPIPNVMLPINVMLGIVALALGIALRGF